MHIRVDDIVKMISGEDRGTEGKVLKVLRDKEKLVVEGVNRVYRHVKRSQKNPQGGRLSKEMPVSISNVMLLCPKCGKPSRTGVQFKDDGTKECYCKKCKGVIRVLSPARPAHATKK
jgi:large subunit ribosomal protein L24